MCMSNEELFALFFFVIIVTVLYRLCLTGRKVVVPLLNIPRYSHFKVENMGCH